MNKPLKWIISNTIFILPLLILLALISVAVSICTVLFALFAGDTIDLASTGNMPLLFKSGIRLVIIIAAEIVLKVINSRLSVSFGGRLEMRLRERVFFNLLGKKWSDVSKFHSGELINRIKSDTNIITSAVMHLIPNGAMFLTRIALALAVLFTIDRQFAVIIVIVSPILLLIGRIYSKKMKFFHKEVQRSEGKSLSYMLESVQNLTVAKAFGSEKGILGELKSINKETLSLRLERNAWSILANVSMLLLFTGGYAFTVIWGAYRIATGALSFGSFTSMLQLVNQVQAPARNMGSLLVTYQNMLASAERLIELEALSGDSVSKTPPPKDLFNDFGTLEFNSVSFSYGGDKILNNASMTVHKGEFVALCGISGSGKSTILRLLLGLIEPDGGEICFTGGGKIDLSPSMRPLFGYVPQGNLLLSGSIFDNIAYYSDITREDAEHAAEIAQMGFVSSLPQGLDTVLGEKGSGLSEGQIQRIAIARALVRNTPILLLDEATSALDEETELNLLNALKREKDRTVFIITHRKKVLDYCDKILTLENGKLIIS